MIVIEAGIDVREKKKKTYSGFSAAFGEREKASTGSTPEYNCHNCFRVPSLHLKVPQLHKSSKHSHHTISTVQSSSSIQSIGLIQAVYTD